MDKRPKRGRPKGSGIDDTKVLDRLHKLQMKQPGAKRTSLIKKIGITHPSIIRRLRDKMQASGQ